jgi:diguanylate cyclase (GGDEF)-like protein
MPELDEAAERELAALIRAVRGRPGVRELRELLAPLVQRASIDPLTGLANRGAFERALATEVARARRHERLLALVLLDVAGLKSINDRLGHLAGDRALLRTAERLRELSRASDLVARWGGDEFVVVLPETGRAGALAFVRKVERALRSRDDLHVRCGVALLPDDGSDAKTLMSVVDQRLCRAKREAASIVAQG